MENVSKNEIEKLCIEVYGSMDESEVKLRKMMLRLKFFVENREMYFFSMCLENKNERFDNDVFKWNYYYNQCKFLLMEIINMRDCMSRF